MLLQKKFILLYAYLVLQTLVMVYFVICWNKGETEYFSWSHAEGSACNLTQYILEHFETEKRHSFGWQQARDSLQLARDPDGPGYVLRVFYERGTRASYDTKGLPCEKGVACRRGAQFYVMPPLLQDKVFAALEYEVYFGRGFEFASGGKLPGLFGGRRDSCKGCSGEGQDCFSARLMWQTGGQYEIYVYIPSTQEGGWNEWCDKYNTAKMAKCIPACGTDIGLTTTDAHKFVPGKWYHIREEVDLGTPNQKGRLALWIDGELIVQMTNIVLRTTDRVKISGLFFSTIYGGNTSNYGNHGDAYTYFRNFRITDNKRKTNFGEYFIETPRMKT